MRFVKMFYFKSKYSYEKIMSPAGILLLMKYYNFKSI